MIASPANDAAAASAARIPALTGRLGLLTTGADTPEVHIYGGTPPIPGEAAPGAVLVAIPFETPVAVINEEDFSIDCTVPMSAYVAGADPTTGTEATWARVITADGAWWADTDVSDLNGSAGIKLDITHLLNGGLVRIISARFYG